MARFADNLGNLGNLKVTVGDCCAKGLGIWAVPLNKIFKFFFF